jgi:hypothetical protein
LPNLFHSGKGNLKVTIFKIQEVDFLVPSVFWVCFTTSLYMKSRAWRSVRLEAAKPTNNLLSSKLTEPRANQQGKRVQIYQKPR